ncbi:glucose 1-dehydrogenase [Haloarculaceae archaeon H-GB2-1]|nr:glucose 1-dehydrogenase [Haloarculaceae archaeon H-GB1-1]MEA5388977.1 glucose 1-dehydrogenase [Haloarculaceae archaeon H-GB11]MEA5407035.1 glucose 1-dehydrogenase [Haloarculaceae archaeon H-GB2-1]
MSDPAVALVTGAGSGIGRAIARRLADEYAVVVNDVDAEAATETAVEIEQDGGDATAIEADVADHDAVDDLVDRTLDAYGRIDLLVNNAGIETVYPFTDLPEAEWDRVHDVNLKGQFLLSQRVANEMIDRDVAGDIVNVSSVHDVLPRTEKIHYDTAKAGVLMLTKDMALELAEHGISVNCVAPGAIETPMNAELLDDPDEIERMNERIPWGRMGKPEEIADAVAFLASQDATYVTGSRLCVDGGLSLDP